MTVSEPMLPFSNSGWRWPADQTGAAESRRLPGSPATPAELDEDLPAALVSPPPLIPRIYPGL
jgi:hypothetical protein